MYVIFRAMFDVNMIAKRSGNKGACGQPCRLAYQLQKNDQDLNEQPLYLLSPKDLCTIENIGQSNRGRE